MNEEILKANANRKLRNIIENTLRDSTRYNGETWLIHGAINELLRLSEKVSIGFAEWHNDISLKKAHQLINKENIDFTDLYNYYINHIYKNEQQNNF